MGAPSAGARPAGASSGQALSVRVLGELSVDGADLGRLDRKARSLLQLLALARGRPVPTDALVDALWGDRAPAKPADQLAVLASRLRRELGRDRVERVDAGYRLRADRIDLDDLEKVVAEAERRAAAGEVDGAVAAARVGLALVRGPVPEVAFDDGWAGAERATAVRLVQRARRVAARTLLAADHWADALEIATADAVADPLDEKAVRLMMRAQAAAGRPALALAAYASLRETLADQLGADPAPETEVLHTAILRGEVVAVPSRVGPLLVGRASQLLHLDNLVARAAADRVPRVARVSGEAGMGKTTLLTSWAAARRDLGDVVLSGTCGPLDRAAPLDVVLTALADHLTTVPDADAVLGAEAGLLAPLLGLGDRSTPTAPDPSLGPATLYAAVTAVLGRVAGTGPAVLVIDDAHLAGPPLADWLAYLRRRSLPLVVVLGARPTERAADAPPLPTTDEVALGPLDRGQVAEVVGEDRAEDLYRRTGGHPLFLAELAAAPTGELPDTLVAAVTARCEQLGAAGEVVRTGAVLGALDVDLLADVLGRSPLDVLADAELACDQGLLVDDAGRLRFRHELVREALVSGTTQRRAVVLHREAGRALARRPDADPLAVAEHADLGGDPALAASALRTAAVRAAERFDHATAEAQLDRSLALVPDGATRVQRARVRIQRARFAEAEDDAVRAEGVGAERWETAAWAAYYDRRFDDALRYADDGAVAASDPATLTRCLVASGRILHARGDLSEAEQRLARAMEAGSGGDRLEAAAWLGVVHAHRSSPDRALELMRPVTRAGVGAEHTSAFLHALLFTGHALAVTGRGADALDCFARYGSEVERRDVPRFVGRGVNFSGWVLRNLGAVGAGLERHHEALGEVREAIPELEVAALEDLAEERIRAGDGEAAAGHLERARSSLHGDLVFGWRLAMKLDLLDAQVRLLTGDAEGALRVADALREAASRAGVPRYDACARLVAHRARAAVGEPVDLDAAWRDLEAVERAVRVEAWWWAGETGVALGRPEWLDRAERLAADLAALAGPHADDVRAEADRRLVGWRAVSVR